MDQTSLGSFLNKKWIMVAGGVLILLIVITFLVSSFSKRQQNTAQPVQKTQSLPINEQDYNANPADFSSMSEEEAKAYEEQKKVDEEYGDWQNNIKTDYPWFRKLPIMNNKYYIYFDLDKKVFIGFLYPEVGDDINVMKADILKLLKEKKGVPVEQFTFEWTVKPK